MSDMQPEDQDLEIASLQLQLQGLKEKFDRAIKSNIELGEIKKIFHEMKKLQIRLDELNRLPPTSNNQ
jgi:hypothetical protein